MASQAFSQPRPDDSSAQSSRHSNCRPGPPICPFPRAAALVGLVLLCLSVRAVMAWKVGGICPDAVVYIHLAESLEKGSFDDGPHKLRLNLYPVILVLLHRTGLEWETAGKLWGVVISSLAVLPLYGWVRRQFDDRVALAAGFLYAAHADLVRWSPEVIRDPTFWFLCALSLYLLWRAVNEVRVWLFVAAGMAVALATLTRFEGLLLLVPLALWAYGRARAAARRELFAGAILCAFVLPLLLVLASLVWLRGHAPWELVRTGPLELVRHWLSAGWAVVTGVFGQAASEAPRGIAWSRMVELFVSAMIKGLTPLFTLSTIVGVTVWRRVWRRREHQAVFYTILLVFLAIWIHMYCAQETCQRYFLPAVLMMCPFAGLGLLACSARLANWAEALGRKSPRCRVKSLAGLAALAPVLFVGTVSLVLLLRRDCQYRADRAEVGRWVRTHLGPSRAVLGQHGVIEVVNYYAQGRCHAFPRGTSDETVEAMARQLSPDLLVMPSVRDRPDGGAAVLKHFEGLGLAPLDGAQLPGGGRRDLTLVRRGGEAVASRSPALSGAQPPVHVASRGSHPAFGSQRAVSQHQLTTSN